VTFASREFNLRPTVFVTSSPPVQAFQEMISPTFYEQLLCAQIPKAQKDSQVTSVFFALFGSAHVKAACKMMAKFTSVRCKFHQHFYVQTSFRQLFLVTFWLWQKIRMQNARVKR